MNMNDNGTSIPTSRSAGKLFVNMVAFVYAVSYVIRYAYLYYFVSNNYTLLDVNYDWNTILLNPLNQSFAICSLIFGLFFLISQPITATKPRIRNAYERPGGFSESAILIFIMFCIVMRFIFGVRLGEGVSSMPLGLSAPVNRAISDLIPGLVLLMMEVFWFKKDIAKYRAWLFVLFLFNIVIAAISTSKAGMIFFAAEFVMFMYLTEQPIFTKPLRWIIMIVLILAAFILGSELRAQAGGGSSEYVDLMSQGNYFGTLMLVVGTFINRLVGLEGYALTCAYTCTSFPSYIPLQADSFFGEAGRIFTQDIVHVDRDFDYRSPGLIAGAALLAGVYGGALLALTFLRGSLALIRLSDKKEFSAAFKISVVFGLFRFILEGTWDVANLVALIVGATIVEVIAIRLRPIRQ